MLKIKDGVSSDVLTEVYGFKKTEIDKDLGICEYELKEKNSATLLQRVNRSIYSVLLEEWNTDCSPISDVVFRLITDGLVEIIPDK